MGRSPNELSNSFKKSGSRNRNIVLGSGGGGGTTTTYTDVIAESTAARALTSQEYTPLIDASGDLLFSLGFTVQREDNTFNNGVFLGGVNGSDGTISFYITAGLFFINLFVKGASVDGTGAITGYPRVNTYMEFEVWHRETAGGGGLRSRTNGCQITPDVTFEPGGVLQRYTEAYLLTLDGTNFGEPGFTVEHLRIRTNDPNEFYAEGGFSGDSTIAQNTVPVGTNIEQMDIGTLIYTQEEAVNRLGIYSISHLGDLVSEQKTKFLASPLAGSDIRWMVVLVGMNEVVQAYSANDIIDDLQDYADTIHSSCPDATVFMLQLVPADEYFTANMITNGSTTRAAVNTAISNGTITGIVPVTAHIGILDSDTPGTLNAEYDAGDGLHPNAAARLVMADAIRDALDANGMFSDSTLSLWGRDRNFNI